MDSATFHRLRVWLQSERALGLQTVGPGQWPAPEENPPPRPTPMRPRLESAPQIVRVPARHAPQVTTQVPDLPLGASAPIPASLPTFDSPSLAPEERRIRLAAMDSEEVSICTHCGLCRTRTKTVFGEGDCNARLMFIGEGPGATEDRTGRPFVGPAGELLNRMIAAMGLTREQTYIANIVKCRAFMPGPSPKDRAPAAEEVAACSPYLVRQVEIIRPQAIVTLGVPATKFVLPATQSMSRVRGTWHTWNGIKVMPTWHPSYLLRCEREGNVEPKRQAWADLQKVMAELGLNVRKRSE